MNEEGGLLDPYATGVYAHLFDALGDPTRLAVLQHLASGEHRVRDLVQHLGLAQSWFNLAQPVATAALINAAELLLKDTGTRVTLCAHLHQPGEDFALGTDAA